jgi:hypothetical protein
MKALTLTQPWATLVALGQKRIETRDWWTSYRGEIAITAAKKFPEGARRLVPQEPFASIVGALPLPTGSVVAVVRLTECFKFDARTAMLIEGRSLLGKLPDHEAEFGDYSAGRYGFVFADVVALREPVPCRGMLNIWEMPADVARLVEQQIAAVTA